MEKNDLAESSEINIFWRSLQFETDFSGDFRMRPVLVDASVGDMF